ncbi:IclR family transcriptional regulator [Glutamicibacter sp.]|uniref:IclR family transcriptional regulator n=1 Tax=Glutamicibacter sp. TaxID=1931995 RepID=UPI003D6B33BA
MSTQSVVNAIHVIEAISTLQPVGLSDLARTLEQPKATVLRALRTLEELGWVEQGEAPAAHWSLTYHAYAVAARTGMRQNIRDLAIAPMSALQEESSETIHLCVPDGRNMVVVERLDSSHTLRAFLALGTTLQMHASGTGLAFLAASNPEFVDDYLSGPLDARTARSLTSPAKIRDELQAIRERGYSINVDGRSEGITSLGAAICDHSGTPIGSVSISGPTSRITESHFNDFGKSLVRTAKMITNRLSGTR